jgi:hypothetical protein
MLPNLELENQKEGEKAFDALKPCRCVEGASNVKTYLKAICNNEQLKVILSMVAILLNDVVKWRISRHMEDENMLQG